MIVVTSGRTYLDIDAYACIVAYAELLNFTGQPAVAVSTAVFNDSISPTARGIMTNFQTDYTPSEEDQFVVVDVSEPENLDGIVRADNILEIIDHHLGNEQYWAAKGIPTDIEFIGAACTQVYERWQQSGKADQISESAAQLLSLGILDNTLNFNASVTTKRDIDAYSVLTKHAHLPADWAEQYFRECQAAAEQDVAASVTNDTKQMVFPGYDKEIMVGQLAVWDASKLVGQVVEMVAARYHFVNLISISEGKNYIITKDPSLQNFLVKVISAKKYSEYYVVTDQLWLRKEIMKAAIDAAESKDNRG